MCSDLQWELVLFLSDTVLVVAVCMAVGNTANCIIKFLFLSMPKVTNFIS